MGLIDFILNLAGMLLWLNWRSAKLDPLSKATPATLAGTLRRAGSARVKRWHFLAALGGIVFFRAWFYWQLGSAIGWTPKIHLQVIVLAFRSDRFWAALLYSALSFVRALILFYFWLLALVMINRNVTVSDPIQKLLRLQLGAVSRWPRTMQSVLPLLLVTGLWVALHPLLVYARVTNPAHSFGHLLLQGVLVGVGTYFSLKCLIPAFLFVHLVVSYVYLGSNPVWDFIGTTARKMLTPLRRLPLNSGKIDFAPLVGIVLTLLLLQALPEFVLRKMGEMKLTLWPQ